MSTTLKEKELEQREFWTTEEMSEKMNVIHHMDCLDFMKRVPDDYFDLCLTDPPYGIDMANMNMGIGNSPKSSKKYNRKWEAKSWDSKVPTDDVFNEIFRISKNQIIWGGNYFNLPAHKYYIVWDKEMTPGVSFGDCEIAWTSYSRSPSIFKYSVFRGKNNKMHPTQKPIPLFEYCIKQENIKTIFDPFLGSGTTAIACKSLGLDWCGCELEEDYVAIANKRLEKVQGALF